MLWARSVVLLVCVFVLTEASLKCQGLTGQISGSVNDPTGSPVVAAEVSLVNQGTGGIGSIRVNGSRAGSLTVTSDGVPNVDTGIQQGPTLLPALESIGEIKVLLTNFQAEYGRNYGGSITTVTKAGTKAFHGGGYYFKRNEALNANDFFRNRDGVKRAFYRYDYPGYYIGGP